MKGIHISIALATYNGASFIQEQLNSFLLQTRLPDELVICDDASTDETCKIIERFKKDAPFNVRYYKNVKNIGYAKNFCQALSLCTGDIVFLSDQDDVWNPKKIETMLNVFEREPAIQLLIHDLEFCSADLKPIGQTKIERIESFANPIKSYVTGMATAIRAPFLKLCLPIPPETTHDDWLHRCAESLGLKVIIPDVLALYRRHESNVTFGSKLNVARKTSPEEFSVNKLSASTLHALSINLVSSKALIVWLLGNKDVLVEQGFTNQLHIDMLISNLESSIAHTSNRIKNLGLRRSARLIPVLKQYFSGGYNEFSGIRSVAKDILLG